MCFRNLPNSKKNQIHKIDASTLHVLFHAYGLFFWFASNLFFTFFTFFTFFSFFSFFEGFCLRPFLASRPRASFWRSVATRRRHPNGPNDPNDPKPPFSKNFQYLPVISSQKWSCKCCKQPKYCESSLSHTFPPLRSECNVCSVCNVCNVKLESDNDRTREYKRSNLEVNSSYVLKCFFAWQVANGTRTDEALLRNSNSLSQWSCLGCNECYSASLFALCHSLSIWHPFSISSTSLSVAMSHSSRHRKFSESSFCL